jgi:hypothetical protein
LSSVSLPLMHGISEAAAVVAENWTQAEGEVNRCALTRSPLGNEAVNEDSH